MTELKTKPTNANVDQFLDTLADPQQSQDCQTNIAMMREATGAPPQMWGESIIGFGNTHYRYASGREGDWFVTGVAPRKQNLTVYLSYGFDQDAVLMERLGKHKVGKACLYVKRLADIDQTVLRELIQRTMEPKGEQGD